MMLCVHRPPQLLTLHLKRFCQDMRGRLAKVSGHIAFSFDLDITAFCARQVSHMLPHALHKKVRLILAWLTWCSH